MRGRIQRQVEAMLGAKEGVTVAHVCRALECSVMEAREAIWPMHRRREVYVKLENGALVFRKVLKGA